MTTRTFASGESCGTSNILQPNSVRQQENFLVNSTDNSIWFSFVASDEFMEIYCLQSAPSPGTVVDDISVYKGSCTSLTQLQVLECTQKDYGNRYPATNLLSIDTKNEVEELQLLDVSTKINLSVQYSKTIDVSCISDGIYLLWCRFKEDDLVYTKIVVQHEK